MWPIWCKSINEPFVCLSDYSCERLIRYWWSYVVLPQNKIDTPSNTKVRRRQELGC